MDPLIAQPERLGDLAERCTGRMEAPDGMLVADLGLIGLVLEVEHTVPRLARLPKENPVERHLSTVVDAGPKVKSPPGLTRRGAHRARRAMWAKERFIQRVGRFCRDEGMRVGEELHQGVALEEIGQLAKAGLSPVHLALAQPPSPKRVVELLPVVDRMGPRRWELRSAETSQGMCLVPVAASAQSDDPAATDHQHHVGAILPGAAQILIDPGVRTHIITSSSLPEISSSCALKPCSAQVCSAVSVQCGRYTPAVRAPPCRIEVGPHSRSGPTKLNIVGRSPRAYAS